MTQDNSRIMRWLILEHKPNFAQWSTVECEGLLWTKSGILRERPKPDHPMVDKEIIILFLEEIEDSWTLPEVFNIQGVSLLKVWCHYGGNINLEKLDQYWNNYRRLSNKEKTRLTNSRYPHPYPFSMGMQLEWSEEFKKIKEKVKSQRDGMHQSSDFDQCLRLLDIAWNRVTDEQYIDKCIDQNKAALPLVLMTTYMLDSLPPEGTSNGRHALVSFLSLDRECGFREMLSMSKMFNADVEKTFRTIARRIKKLDTQLRDEPKRQECLDESYISSHLATLRVELEKLLYQAKRQSEETTRLLNRNPMH